MYGEARGNIDILYQIICIYCTINLLHILIIQILHYQPIKNYTIKINPHTRELKFNHALSNYLKLLLNITLGCHTKCQYF